MGKIVIFCRFIMLAVLATTTGCSNDFTPFVGDSTPVAVVNMIAEPDSVIKVSVTRSWYYADCKPDVVLSDADVSIFVNGLHEEKLRFDDVAEVYRSEYRARENDSIAVNVSTRGYGEARGSTVVPVKVKVGRRQFESAIERDYNSIVDTNDGQLSYMYNIVLHYTLEIEDVAGEDNYFMLVGNVECESPLLGDNNNPLDVLMKPSSYIEFLDYRSYVTLFSDRNFRGEKYELKCKTKYSLYDIMSVAAGNRIGNEIRLYSISEDYYRYMLSIYLRQDGVNSDFEDWGLSDAVPIYTNVSPGRGIVASQSVDTWLHDVTDVLLYYHKLLYPND